LKILSPAKINIFLFVTGKRVDGYHNIISLIDKVTIYDRIDIKLIKEGIIVRCDNPEVPIDEKNLAGVSCKEFFKRVGYNGGVEINIKKVIPCGSGLGGGSSNAASVLKSLNSIFKNRLDNYELIEIGRTVGSDVPFFLKKGPAICFGRGDELIPVKLGSPRWYVIIYPNINLSTKDVYEGLDLSEIPTSSPFNFLEKSAVNIAPELKEVKRFFPKKGPFIVSMTGSGSAYFGLFFEYRKAYKFYKLILKRSKNVFLAKGIDR